MRKNRGMLDASDLLLTTIKAWCIMVRMRSGGGSYGVGKCRGLENNN